MSKLSSNYPDSLIDKYWWLLLIALNAYIYSAHYAGIYSFPFDFTYSFYGFVAFWTTAVKHHIVPDWVPYQAMGYPLLMNPQAYFFYLPNWFFVLSGIPYTGHAHNVLQCLHVLVGSIGFFVFSNLLVRNKNAALFGGIAFQLFGGFFSNSEHLDIVRSFAFIPWLFWSLHTTPEQKELTYRNLLLPVFVLFIGTGAYPGSVISLYLLSGIYIISSAINCVFHTGNLKLVLRLSALFVWGVVLASPQIFAGVIFGSETVRVTTALEVEKWGWDLRSLPSILFSWLRPDVTSMRSLFIGIPTFVLIFFVDRLAVWRIGPWFVVCFTALVLAPGNQSFFYRFLAEISPIFHYSRFPAVDYRGILAVFLVLLAVFGLERIMREKERMRLANCFFAATFAYALLISGVLGININNSEIYSSGVSLGLTLLILVLSIRLRLKGAVLPLIFAVLLIFDATRVIWSLEQHWKSPPLDQVYALNFGISDTSDLPITSQFISPLKTRPGRTEEEKHLSWRGYLDGSFHTDDYTGLVLLNRYQISQNPILLDYIKEEWRAVLIPNLEICDDQNKLATILSARQTDLKNGETVAQTSYGIDDVTYQINTSTPIIFVENEIFFPGWRAIIHDTQGQNLAIQAKNCLGLRAWEIPSAGKLQIDTKFEMPYSRIVMLIAASSAIIYLIFFGNAYIHNYRGK